MMIENPKKKRKPRRSFLWLMIFALVMVLVGLHWWTNDQKSQAACLGNAAQSVPFAFRDITIQFSAREPRLFSFPKSEERSPIPSIAFSPDSQYLAIARWQIDVWDIAAKEWYRILAPEEKERIADIQFDPTGNFIAELTTESTTDNIARIWDIASKAIISKFPLNARYWHSLKFSSDGSDLYIVGSDFNKIDLSNGRREKIYYSDRYIRNFDISTDDSCFVITEADRSTHSGDNTIILDVQSHASRVIAAGNWAVFIPGSLTLIEAGDYRVKSKVRVIDFVAHAEYTLTDFHELMAINAQGTLLALTDQEKSIEIWSLINGKKIGEFTNFEGKIFDMVFSPDSRFLAGSGDDEVYLWEIELH